jgi:phage terminase large subunit GpA-like protein
MADYAQIEQIVKDVVEGIRPPRRVSVSDCAAESLRIEMSGGYAGPWDAALTPYMVVPMNTLKSRRFEAVVFVSPARTGKTLALLDAWITHAVVADPGDMGLYFPTQTLAHDYRKRRIARLHRYSEAMREMLSPRAHDDTIELVIYRHGMLLNLGWPSSSQLAQRDLRYVALSDYDSFPDDVSKEGAPFDLARKRVQVAGSSGKALVESSPKRPVMTHQWSPDGPHCAPPVAGGILPIYNRGDRRRWYWQCLDGCHAWFEAPAMPRFDVLDSPEAAAQTAHVACPHCGQVYRQEDKRRLNGNSAPTAANPFGGWLAEGETLHPSGRRTGEPRPSSLASFWLLGCAAAFQSWESIVLKYLLALREFDVSGDESSLKTTVNTDQGLPYTPRSLAAARDPEALVNRVEDLERYQVPDGVRVILAAVDVQAASFEVGVVGYGVGGERWLLDRYSIRYTADKTAVQPAVYGEHWDLLTERVVHGTYQLADGRELRVYRSCCDSGGYHDRRNKADSTARAYEWWRGLKVAGLGHRVRLLKGTVAAGAPFQRESFPDSSRRTDRSAGSRGDVPVLILHTDRLKDVLSADLQRDVPGPGYIHLPQWLSQAHLSELTAEQRTPKGWENPARKRNETWDLLTYCHGLWLSIGGDKINWEAPPPWAMLPEVNTETVTAEQRRELKGRPTAASAPSARGIRFRQR